MFTPTCMYILARLAPIWGSIRTYRLPLHNLELHGPKIIHAKYQNIQLAALWEDIFLRLFSCKHIVNFGSPVWGPIWLNKLSLNKRFQGSWKCEKFTNDDGQMLIRIVHLNLWMFHTKNQCIQASGSWEEYF